jgi:hypothetical protein
MQPRDPRRRVWGEHLPRRRGDPLCTPEGDRPVADGSLQCAYGGKTRTPPAPLVSHRGRVPGLDLLLPPGGLTRSGRRAVHCRFRHYQAPVFAAAFACNQRRRPVCRRRARRLCIRPGACAAGRLRSRLLGDASERASARQPRLLLVDRSGSVTSALPTQLVELMGEDAR